MKYLVCILGPKAIGKHDVQNQLHWYNNAVTIPVKTNNFNRFQEKNFIDNAELSKLRIDGDLITNRYERDTNHQYCVTESDTFTAMAKSRIGVVVTSVTMTLDIVAYSTALANKQKVFWKPVVVYLQAPEYFALSKYLNKYPDNLNLNTLKDFKAYCHGTLEYLQTLKLKGNLPHLVILDATENSGKIADKVVNSLNVL